MTYTVKDYCDAVHKFAPLSLAMSWDNPGLLIGSEDAPVSRAVLALDATVSVIDEAKALDAQLIITHHPIIFQPLKTVPATSPVYRAIAAGIAVLCAHTNLDIAKGGVNDTLAEQLGLANTAILEQTRANPYYKVGVYVPRESAEAVYEAMTRAGAGRQGDYAGAAFFGEGKGRFLPLDGANPAIGRVGDLEIVDEVRVEMLVSPGDLPGVLLALRNAHPYEEPAYDVFETRFDIAREGIGRVGNLPKALSPDEFARHVIKSLGVGGIRYLPGAREISRVAVCGGAGADYIKQAVEMGAHALVTGEAKHHHLLAAKDLGFTLVDAGHYATEAVVIPKLEDALKQALPGADIVLAKACADPARYLAQ